MGPATFSSPTESRGDANLDLLGEKSQRLDGLGEVTFGRVEMDWMQRYHLPGLLSAPSCLHYLAVTNLHVVFLVGAKARAAGSH